uniref:Uncharacterized protein n=1 Tax=Myotis myotis TaxID=51298 RepID=A0A7J7RRU9_MYOMY|nr:hypothetical protein mMyoMyo1_010204 [Myotis myotis]
MATFFPPSSEFLWTHCLPEPKLLTQQEFQLPSAHPHPFHPSPSPSWGPSPHGVALGLPLPDLGSHLSPLPGMSHLRLEETPQFQAPPFLLQPAPLTSQGAGLSPTGSQHTRPPQTQSPLAPLSPPARAPSGQRLVPAGAWAPGGGSFPVVWCATLVGSNPGSGDLRQRMGLSGPGSHLSKGRTVGRSPGFVP